MLYFNETRIRQEANQDETGAWRWNSNGNYLFSNCLEDAGMDFDFTAQNTARANQVHEQLEEYQDRMQDHEYSSEELGEMRAAFGEGETIVNVFTGKKIIL